MKISKYFSPLSPVPQNDEMSVDEITLERKQRFLPQLRVWYDRSVQEYQEKLTKNDMATNRNRSIRRKRKLECSGCGMKQCTQCSLNEANKEMLHHGAYIEEIESEIETLQRRIDSQHNAPQMIPPCPEPPCFDSDEDSESDDDDVQEEPDVKQEADDSYASFQISIGITNTIKSEPMENDDEDVPTDGSEEESSDESMKEESQNTIKTEESYRDYPSTPPQSDYTTDSDDSEDEADTEDEEPRPIRSILDLLNQ